MELNIHQVRLVEIEHRSDEDDPNGDLVCGFEYKNEWYSLNDCCRFINNCCDYFDGYIGLNYFSSIYVKVHKYSDSLIVALVTC